MSTEKKEIVNDVTKQVLCQYCRRHKNPEQIVALKPKPCCDQCKLRKGWRAPNV